MKKYKLLIIPIVIVLSIYACEKFNNDNNNDNVIIYNEKAEQIYFNLLDAYNDSCTSCLEQILTDWSNEYTPKMNIPDSQLNVYDVFKEFYSPWNLARISNSEFGDSIYSSNSYYIIQASIRYNNDFRVYEGNYFAGEHSTVTDFRPSILNDTINTLYLFDDYNLAINVFLGSQSVDGIINETIPVITTEETNKRNKFLNNYLFFFPGHWGNYWHLETHPKVEVISFNTEQDSAQIYFRLGYQGGEVILGKENNNWIIVDHYMTWIE